MFVSLFNNSVQFGGLCWRVEDAFDGGHGQKVLPLQVSGQGELAGVPGFAEGALEGLQIAAFLVLVAG